MGSDAERRVWAAMPAGSRDALAALPSADLRTLLLGVARDRAEAVRPAQVLRRWNEDRFVRPSAADPRALSRVERRMLVRHLAFRRTSSVDRMALDGPR
ncbi:hypothetical protein [Micromonospora tulbaghiae]|uniref:hypothetical protein n=1 Tax=Micromonospora tulbaghiae TaxID=479978 RepID=UPI0011BE68CF|nr:hypothetical protein [Micromonospora provocatoris]